MFCLVLTLYAELSPVNGFCWNSTLPVTGRVAVVGAAAAAVRLPVEVWKAERVMRPREAATSVG